MNESNKKVAMITGGASGIGRALCEELAGPAAVVIVADVNVEGAKQVAAHINGKGGQALAEALDVSDATAVKSLIRRVTTEHQQLDYMFNNAGIAVGAEARDMDLEHFRSVVDTNLWGVIYGSIYAYDVMRKQGWGHIINTASMAGLLPFPSQTAYVATKFAVVGFSKSLRLEGADFGVKVSVVCPGFVRTGIFESSQLIKVDRQKLLAKLPPRMMPPQQAAQIILKGISKNRAVIVFPFVARIFWWLYRLHPVLLAPIHRKMIADFRRLRAASE